MRETGVPCILNGGGFVVNAFFHLIAVTVLMANFSCFLAEYLKVYGEFRADSCGIICPRVGF